MNTGLEYNVTGPIGAAATLGLIVLQTDETLEQDMVQAFPQQDVAIYVSRVESAPDVTPETLAQMQPRLTQSAALLPPSLTFGAVGYGCTSGTSVIGAQAVHGAVRSGCDTGAVSDPFSALIAACAALDVSRIAILSPYVAEVNTHLVAALQVAGIEVAVLGSFNVAQEAIVARIDPASLQAAAIELVRGQDVEALFLSCTNLRTFPVLEPLEDALGLPVISSNQALAWHMGTLSGVKAQAPGRLRDV